MTNVTDVSTQIRLTAVAKVKRLAEQWHRLTEKLQQYLTASSEQMNSATEDAEREHKRNIHTSRPKYFG